MIKIEWKKDNEKEEKNSTSVLLNRAIIQSPCSVAWYEVQQEVYWITIQLNVVIKVYGYVW